MAGCSIVLLLCIFVPIFFAVAAIFLGTMAASALMMIGSAAALYYLKKRGFFEKYRNDPDDMKRFFAMAVKIVLIILLSVNTMACVALGVIAAAIAAQ